MRRRLWLRGSRSWRSTKKKWSGGTPLSNKKGLMSLLLSKSKLKLKEKLFSRNSQGRKLNEEHNQNSLKI